MAGGSFFTLLDDIASVLDDVAAMTKIAAKKTSGVLGDDLALNAQQVTGVNANREIPVILAVAKGSALNKIILIPIALFISSFFPALITPLLMVGGGFLCFEGFEKIWHIIRSNKEHDDRHKKDHRTHLSASTEELLQLEQDKIKGAIRTDFILSAEIVVISLGTVADRALSIQVAVLCGIGALMTIGVYGLVSAIVKIDDVGLYLISKKTTMSLAIGQGLLTFAPLLMKTLSVSGTIAMFLVGGGIISHGLHIGLAEDSLVMGSGFELLVGFSAGGIIFCCYQGVSALISKIKN